MTRKLPFNSIYLHVAFCVFVFIIFIGGMLSNARPFAEVAPRGLLVFGLFLAGIYAGRGLFKYSFQPWNAGRFVSLGVVLIIVLSFAMAAVSLTFPFEGSLPARAILSAPVALLLELIGFGISMARQVVRDQMDDMEIKKTQKESEVTLLQSQLNPHFLFNTLNNIYGISVSDPQRIPGLILKLSELLRYSVYTTRLQMVTLDQELDYIQNYLEFEKLRNKDRLVLESNLGEIDAGEIAIAPLLLIVFVENAFKHARHSAADVIEVKVNLHLEGTEVNFHVTNSFSSKAQEDDPFDEFSGVGMDNVKKRLELVYPQAHTLAAYQENNFYYVHLKLRTV